jgi:peptidoglycan/LPS O-acetylase OafA/YrhL
MRRVFARRCSFPIARFPSNSPVGLGRLAFGTFLCHQFVLYALEMTIGRWIPKPAGPAILIGLALLAMALSLGITALAAKTHFGRRLFAVT